MQIDNRWKKIDLCIKGLYTTRNNPRPEMIPRFFHTRPEMIPEELLEFNGMTFNSP